MADRKQLITDLKESVVRELTGDCGKSEKEAKDNTRSIRLPSKVKFICGGDTVRIIMRLEGAGYIKSGDDFVNMQEDEAAFEGWALALHVHLNKNIQLELETNGEAVPAWTREKPHYNRFLYRLKKFDAIYGWFSIEEKLGKVVEDFSRYLFESGVTFCNNIADGPADVGPGTETQVEAAFADHLDLLYTYSANLFRQLPVGLFEGTVGGKTSIFTHKKSAIDLWGLHEDASGTQLVIYELKAQNKQMGIISELMFYANYAYDMYLQRNNFTPSPPMEGNKDLRGYEYLAEANVTGIRAYMLTDALHPLITPKMLKEMNSESIRDDALKYDALEYKWEKKNGDIVITGVKSCF